MIIDLWLDYEEPTEIPQWYSRWSMTTAISALLGRQCSIEFGSSEFFPNLYTMLIGSAGSRKSSAIKSASKAIGELGFSRFSSTKVTKEQFLVELASDEFVNDDPLGFDELNAPKEMFISADEANDFFGINNGTFLSMLGTMWDWNDDKPYTSSIKTGKSVAIMNPTINILAGNTRTGFFQAFPPEIFGQGFFSRLLLIYGVPVDHKVTFPHKNAELKIKILNLLGEIKARSHGLFTYTPEAKELVEHIYLNWRGFSDIRFESYKQRRLPHLSKLMLNRAVTMLRGDNKIHYDDVIYAHSLLSVTEALMPRAIEGMGTGRNAVLNQKVLEAIDSFLYANNKPATPIDLWGDLLHDFQSLSGLMDVVNGLRIANKIVVENGFILPVLPNFGYLKKDPLIKLDFFRDQELKLIGGRT